MAVNLSSYQIRAQHFAESLASVLQESAAAQSDELERRFEMAVMQFLRADYRFASAPSSRSPRASTSCGHRRTATSPSSR